MGKYDIAVKCAQIKNLIKENQYVRAMEEIEMLDFKKIPDISELYLFADIFLKAEKLNIAKKLYYTVYKRTASRPALYRLLMLVIRMGDVEEARELYLTYEIIAGITLDTYELRYRLARAEGASGEKLIEILEELKREEYTEEWGLQLAKLYEIQGMREECIRECEDIKTWFGVGSIVNKAMELRARCMSPDWVKPIADEIPEPEELEDFVETEEKVAYAPVRVEEIVLQETEPPEENWRETERSEQAEREKVQLPEETIEEKPEETIEETAEEKPEETTEEAPAEEKPEETIEESAEEMTEAPGSPVKHGFLSRLAQYFKVDLDEEQEEEEEEFQEGIVEPEEREEFPGQELDTYKQQSTAELNIKEVLAKEVGGIISEGKSPRAAVTMKARPHPLSQTKPKLESLDDRLKEVERNQELENLEDTMNLQKVQVKSHPLGRVTQADTEEDFSSRGVGYRTLKGTIYKMREENKRINFALAGGEEGISLAVAKRLFKELKKMNYFEAGNIGKIAAEKLDEVDLEEWAEKFVGGCMYIMNAPALSQASVGNLNRLIDKYQRQIVIILEGNYEEMDSFLGYQKELSEKMSYKIKL